MSGQFCRVCDEESDLSYKCHRCGKPFDGDGDSSGAQSLRPDGGTDLKELSTHDLVGKALGELGDRDVTNGIPKQEVVSWITSRTELVSQDVHDATNWLVKRGRIYEPSPDRLRRTDADDECWLTVVWHEALVEARVAVSDLDLRYLEDRYNAANPDEVEELVEQAQKEVLRRDNGKITLDDLDAAEEKLEQLGDHEIVTDGGTIAAGSDRISWPRRFESGNPIVGYHCKNCGEEIEHVYQPSLLRHCPGCGGNPQGVRAFEVESLVDERRERLQEQLAEHFGHPMSNDPECAVCGTDENVHVDPGETLEDFEYRCADHHLFGYSFWWQPGDQPGLLTREWIETCDECRAEFTSVFGVSYRSERGSYERDLCLRCTDPEWLRRVCDESFALGGESA